jgi:hypothetical protein
VHDSVALGEGDDPCDPVGVIDGVAVCEAVRVPESEDPKLGVWELVVPWEPVWVGDAEGVTVAEPDCEDVDTCDAVCEPVRVAEALCVCEAVGEIVCVSEALPVTLCVAACDDVSVLVAEGDGVGDEVIACVPDWLAVCVGVRVRVGTKDVVCVGVGAPEDVPLAVDEAVQDGDGVWVRVLD